MAKRRHAEIAGAGFAGLTAAAALGQRGWSVRVHEAGPQLRAFGAGIFIWDNGLRVLEAVGAYQGVMTGVHEAEFHETRNEKGELLGRRSFKQGTDTRMVTMTRQQLYAPLLAAAQRAGAEIVPNSKAVGATPEGALLLADGSALPADLVIGADGVRSKVRDSLDLLSEHETYGYGIARLLVPRTPEEAASAYWQNVMNFWSPTRRVLYCPCNPRDLYIALGAHVTDEPAVAIPVRKDVWIETFPRLEPILSRIGDNARYDEYEMVKVRTWSVGRTALVGDSAHGMPPSLGQGAGCAMMNALSLAAAVATAEDIEGALVEWERRERPLTEHTQDASSEYARTRAGSDGRDKFTTDVLRAAAHVPIAAHGAAAAPRT